MSLLGCHSSNMPSDIISRVRITYELSIKLQAFASVVTSPKVRVSVPTGAQKAELT